MGLDMYAFARKPGAEESVELAYWRKFNALHGYMEDLYRSRGGMETFNCVQLPLTEADLDNLEETLKGGALVPREGFFFGVQEIHEEDVEATHQFIAAAREAIAEGKEVVYDSWW